MRIVKDLEVVEKCPHCTRTIAFNVGDFGHIDSQKAYATCVCGKVVGCYFSHMEKPMREELKAKLG